MFGRADELTKLGSKSSDEAGLGWAAPSTPGGSRLPWAQGSALEIIQPQQNPDAVLAAPLSRASGPAKRPGDGAKAAGGFGSLGDLGSDDPFLQGRSSAW